MTTPSTEAVCAKCHKERGLKSDSWHHPPPSGLEPTCPRCYDHAFRPQVAEDAVEEAWANYDYAYGAVFAFEDHAEWRAALDAHRAKVEQAVREAAVKDAEARSAALEQARELAGKSGLSVEYSRRHLAGRDAISAEEYGHGAVRDLCIMAFISGAEYEASELTTALRGEPVAEGQQEVER